MRGGGEGNLASLEGGGLGPAVEPNHLGAGVFFMSERGLGHYRVPHMPDIVLAN